MDAFEHIEALETALEELRQYVDEKLPSLELLQRLETLEEQNTHAERWHATYNAALPECIRQLVGVNTDAERAERAHVMAIAHANRRHGWLEPGPEG